MSGFRYCLVLVFAGFGACAYGQPKSEALQVPSENNHLIFFTKSLTNQPGYLQRHKIWETQYADVTWLETYSIMIYVKYANAGKFHYINPDWRWHQKNYPPDYHAYSPRKRIRQKLFRFNCMYSLPLPAGANSYLVLIGSFCHGNPHNNSKLASQISKFKAFDLKPNESIYLDLNPEDLSKSTLTVIPTPTDDGPCEFRDKYLKEQAEKRRPAIEDKSL
ncbi:MAG: hypothetical protein KDK39_03705 [Leptospiraceae bacterium]|nr:hypothetical protein [Leptospiraceae bacterium]